MYYQSYFLFHLFPISIAHQTPMVQYTHPLFVHIHWPNNWQKKTEQANSQIIIFIPPTWPSYSCPHQIQLFQYFPSLFSTITVQWIEFFLFGFNKIKGKSIVHFLSFFIYGFMDKSVVYSLLFTDLTKHR